ncbi:MAG: PAS domain S-box protein [Sphingomonas fennica]
MRIASAGPDEAQRLLALAEFAITEGETDAVLDDLADLACRLFGAPIALVTLVDGARAIFGGRSGLDGCGADRDIAFCSHALAGEEMLVVPDTALDPRFADNPLVSGSDPLRFYAGAPLRAHSGHMLGTLCVIDRRPRVGLAARDRRALRILAALAMDRLEARRQAKACAAGEQPFRLMAATAPDAIVCADGGGSIRFWNPAAEALLGHPAARAVGRRLDLLVPRRHAGRCHRALRRLAAAGTPAVLRPPLPLTALHSDGGERPVELSIAMWREDGRTSFGLVLRDPADRREAARCRDGLAAVSVPPREVFA